MAESIAARLHVLDIDMEKSAFERSQKLVLATREALVKISADEHANRLQMGQVFQRLSIDIEASFFHLGLSEVQEEHLTVMLKRHLGEAMEVFDQSDQIEDHLQTLINKLHA